MTKKIPKKVVLIIVAIFIVIAVLGIWYFQKAEPGQDFVDTFFDFDFPEFTVDGDGENVGGSLLDGKKEKEKLPFFRQISDTPTAGFVFFKKEDEIGTTTPFVRFIERSTGYVYETNIETMVRVRKSNTTIPRIYEAMFGEEGNDVILRYLDDDNITIQSFAGNITNNESGVDGVIEGDFMQKNLKELVLSPDRKNIFYLASLNKGVIGTVSDIGNSNPSNIFKFPFSEWLPQWTQAGIYLTTKPSYDTSGYLYKLNTRNGTLQKIIGDIDGLTTLVSNSGEKILYSKSTANGVVSYIYDTSKKESVETPFNTLPEKCVWGVGDTKTYCAVTIYFKDGNYPDQWYQGKISFIDILLIFAFINLTTVHGKMTRKIILLELIDNFIKVENLQSKYG